MSRGRGSGRAMQSHRFRGGHLLVGSSAGHADEREPLHASDSVRRALRSRVMDAREIDAVLQDEVALGLLSDQQLCRFAYVAPDGTPRVVPVGIIWKDETFLVFTSTNAAKITALQRDPHVAITIDTEDFPPHVLLIRGRASLTLVDGVPQEQIDASQATSSPEEHAAWLADAEKLYDQMYKIEVVPSWAKVLDFEKRLPSNVEELMRQKGSRETRGGSLD